MANSLDRWLLPRAWADTEHLTRGRTNDEAVTRIGWGSVKSLHLLPLQVLGFLAQRSPPVTHDEPVLVVAAIENDGHRHLPSSTSRKVLGLEYLLDGGGLGQVKADHRLLVDDLSHDTNLDTELLDEGIVSVKAAIELLHTVEVEVGPFARLLLYAITSGVGGVDLLELDDGILYSAGGESTPVADQQGRGLGRQTGRVLED